MSDIIIEMFERIKAEQAQHKALQPNDYIDEDYIFTKIDGQLIRSNYVTKHFKDVLAKNDMPPIRLHDLRHNAASYLMHLGFSIKEIQMWLGHGDIGTMMNLYTHIDLAAKRNIVDSLNEKFIKFG
jgi:integrase